MRFQRPACFLAASLLWLSALGCEGERTPQGPNVLIVVLDTTRVDVLSAYNPTKPTSPNLDALAQQGVRFTRAFATGFWTLPSHASLLTGQYPSDHQATSETGQLPQEASTLAEDLDRVGYRTGAFVSNPWLSEERGFAQGFSVFEAVWESADRYASALALDRETVRRALEFIDTGDREEGGGAPFFAFLNLNSSHMPYNPDPLVLAELSSGPRSIDRSARLRKLVGGWEHYAGQVELDEMDYRMLREFYEAEVAMLDGLLGSLIEGLRERNELDNTLVIITSDHGENIGEHGMIDHILSLHETTLHIPLVIRYPRHFEGGRVDERLVSLVDLRPTVLDVLGLSEMFTGGEAKSLLDTDHAGHAFVVAENDRPIQGVENLLTLDPDFDTGPVDRRTRMLRTDRYKLIWQEGGPFLLYDLSSDPKEQFDLSVSDPERLAKMTEQLNRWMQARSSSPRPSALESQDEKAEKELRALGYIE